MEPKYKVGDIVKTTVTGESWEFIESSFITTINGYEQPGYELKDGPKILESQIIDIMDALPD